MLERLGVVHAEVLDVIGLHAGALHLRRRVNAGEAFDIAPLGWFAHADFGGIVSARNPGFKIIEMLVVRGILL